VIIFFKRMFKQLGIDIHDLSTFINSDSDDFDDLETAYRHLEKI
jgi:hypothetical protein